MKDQASGIERRMRNSPVKDKVVIFGIGNEYREDDGAGIFVAHLLEKIPFKNCYIFSNQGETLSLLDQWTGAPLAIVIDAVQADLKPGTILTLNGFSEISRESWNGFSSHSIDLPALLALARELNQLPSELRIIGIVGQKFGYGRYLTPEVEDACVQVAKEIAQLVTDHLPSSDVKQRVSIQIDQERIRRVEI